MEKEYIACDFFSGAGGLSEGLKDAGIKVAVANEINKHAAMTYNFNHPNTFLFQKDIREIKSREVIDITGNDIFLVAGGPPCQGVSLAGRRDINDSRNSLFREFAMVVGKLEPRFFLMENVVGLLSMNKGRLIESIEKLFNEIGYNVSKRVFNSVDFGVPQNRRRLFLFGSRKDKDDINSMHAKKTEIITTWDAISDLDFLKSGEFTQNYMKPPLTNYQKEMRKNSKVLYNHKAPKHNKSTMRRFSMLREGQSIKDLPQHIRIKKRVMYKLRKSEPSRTITTLPDDYVHYNQNRILTVREMSRLQSFKDSYVFFGPKSTGGLKRKIDCPQYTQVGNAVPPFMGKGISEWILSI